MRRTWGTLAAAAVLAAGLAGCIQGSRIIQERQFTPCSKGEACAKCRGHGDYRCAACFGRGKRPCTQCQQKGTVPCRTCGGDGVPLFGDFCAKCNGTGQLTCPHCGGNFEMASCPDCKGTGMIKCGTHTVLFRCRDCGATFDYKPKKCLKCAGGE